LNHQNLMHQGLVDIHSHVLYGVDDGARTLEDSVAMVRLAAEHGTTDLVATPHANPKYRFDPQIVKERLAEISAASDHVLRLHSGCDFHLSYDNIQDAIANPGKYSINQHHYLMVEFSDLLIFHNTAEIFLRLQDAGMIPVITHPERNGLLRQRADQIAGWVAGGACVQVTAQSVLGEFGQRAADFARTLLDRRLVHFLASDGHDCEHRPPRLDLAQEWVKEHYGEELAEALCATNPRATLTGESLGGTEAAGTTESRKWYQIWR
jgi:protein-tyrosine phosphatase